MDNQKRIATSLADEPTVLKIALEALSKPHPGGTNRMIQAERSHQPLAGSHFANRIRSLGYAVAHR